MVHRQGLVVSLMLFVAGASAWLLAAHARTQVVQAGFWFEHVTFDDAEVEADRLGGGVTQEEMTTIQSIGLSELRAAFAGMRIAFSDDRQAPFSVRVEQTLRHPILQKSAFAGESRGVWPLGGKGALNFRLLASNAIAYAPPGADRATKIEAIGRGVGRAAAHEFAHQILGSKDIHHARDVQSYEYWTADRREQYYGPMRWDVAGPMLRKRLKPATSNLESRIF
jgi:hypothetical protein